MGKTAPIERGWDQLQAKLSDQREQRLAYLLYHCGLEPAEIVRYWPTGMERCPQVRRCGRIIFRATHEGN